MKRLNASCLAVCALVAFGIQAAEETPKQDLALEGARWLAKPVGYVCAADIAKTVTAPTDLASLGVAFESAVTDYSLDNAVVLATFSPEAGTTCRYSVRVLADNAGRTLNLVESRAFAAQGEASCDAGKALLDASFAADKYLWKERGHILTILAPNASAAELCGQGVDTVGIQFTLVGKIN